MYEKNLKQKLRKQSKNRTKRVGCYYSFLTIVLLIFLIHVSISAALNILKSVNYYGKIKTMKEIQIQATEENKKLKEDLSKSGTMRSLEAIARNNLKMADKDEVLVIINEDKNKEQDLQKETKS